jgi:hypothetical protein
MMGGGGGVQKKRGLCTFESSRATATECAAVEEAADVQPPTGWCVAFSRQPPRRRCAALRRELAPGPSPHYNTTKKNFSHTLYLSGFLISSFFLLLCNVRKVKGN